MNRNKKLFIALEKTDNSSFWNVYTSLKLAINSCEEGQEILEVEIKRSCGFVVKSTQPKKD